MPAEGSVSCYRIDNQTCTHRVQTLTVCTGAPENIFLSDRSAVETDANGYWHCPHPQLDDRDVCVFHAEAGIVDDETLARGFTAALAAANRADTRHKTRRRKQFLGATLDTLALDDDVVRATNNFPLDLRASKIGDLSFRNAIVDAPIDLRGATIDTVVGTNARLSRLYAQYVTAEEILLDQANIQRCYLDHLDATRVRLFQADVDYMDASTDHVDYGNFMYATFDEAGLIDGNFDLLTFFGARFESAYCNDLTTQYLNFAFVQSWEIHFGGATITAATFEGTTVDRAYFDAAELDRSAFPRVEFDWARFEGADLGVAQFERAEFETALFDDVSYDQSFGLRHTTVADLSLDITNTQRSSSDRPYVDLRDATVDAGTFRLADKPNAIYDLENTTMGDVLVQHESGTVAPIRLLRVVDTRFDGFDFDQQRDESPVLGLAEYDYDLHSLTDGAAVAITTGRDIQSVASRLHAHLESRERDTLGATAVDNRVDFEAIDRGAIPDATGDEARRRATTNRSPAQSLQRLEATAPCDPSPARLEKTYLEAKNGATAVGNGFTAGQFFWREHAYRRDMYRDRFWSSEPYGRLRPFRQWTRSTFLRLTCGYGERPRNVVYSSLVVIAVFSLYYRFGPTGPGPQTSLLDAAVFSAQSFITFLVGTPPQPPSLAVRAASSVEGFLGAFFVALFVFALTRQIHR